jgi:hypothetical protein
MLFAVFGTAISATVVGGGVYVLGQVCLQVTDCTHRNSMPITLLHSKHLFCHCFRLELSLNSAL